MTIRLGPSFPSPGDQYSRHDEAQFRALVASSLQKSQATTSLDGDKGDVVVSDAGATMTVQPAAARRLTRAFIMFLA